MLRLKIYEIKESNQVVELSFYDKSKANHDILVKLTIDKEDKLIIYERQSQKDTYVVKSKIFNIVSDYKWNTVFDILGGFISISPYSICVSERHRESYQIPINNYTEKLINHIKELKEKIQ